MIRRGRAPLLLVSVALLFAAACQMQLAVDVAMEADGSGTVEVTVAVDDEALARVGGDLAAVVDVEQLEADGWEVRPAGRGDDGLTRLVLHQAFPDPAAGERVLAGLGGDDGPLQGFRLERSRSLWRDEWSFEGRVDFSKGAGATVIADESVRPLADQLGSAVDRLLQVRVRVRLPGEVTSNATTKADNGAIWAIGLSDEPVALSATGTESHAAVVVAAALGGVLVLVGGVVLLIRLAVRHVDRGG